MSSTATASTPPSFAVSISSSIWPAFLRASIRTLSRCCAKVRCHKGFHCPISHQCRTLSGVGVHHQRRLESFVPPLWPIARLVGVTRIRSPKIFRLRRQHFLRGLLVRTLFDLPSSKVAISIANFARSVAWSTIRRRNFRVHVPLPMHRFAVPAGATLRSALRRAPGSGLFITAVAHPDLSRTVSFHQGRDVSRSHPSSVAARS